MPMDKKVVLQIMTQVARRPHLWMTAIHQTWRIRRTGWYRKPPFLPVPDSSYLRFRLHTAYGDGDGQQKIPIDVVTYLEWCRNWRSTGG